MSKPFSIYDHGFEHISKVVDNNIQRVKDYKEGKINYYPTAFTKLNRKLMGGLLPGKYYVIGARPGMGKSAFSNQLIFELLEINKDKKIIVLYWSFEMSGEDQIFRLGSQKTKKELYEIMSKGGVEFADEHFIAYTKAVSDYRNYPVYFCEKPVSSSTIYNINKQVYNTNPEWQIINILDHSRYVSKEQEQDELRMLNNLSKNLHLCCVEFKSINLLLSQLNRDIEKDSRSKNQYKPLLSDLFGADSVGQDADTVIIFNRPYDVYGITSKYEGYDPRGLLAAHIVKNRGGELGLVAYDTDYKHFTIWERMEEMKLNTQSSKRKLKVTVETDDDKIW